MCSNIHNYNIKYWYYAQGYARLRQLWISLNTCKNATQRTPWGQKDFILRRVRIRNVPLKHARNLIDRPNYGQSHINHMSSTSTPIINIKCKHFLLIEYTFTGTEKEVLQKQLYCTLQPTVPLLNEFGVDHQLKVIHSNPVRRTGEEDFDGSLKIESYCSEETLPVQSVKKSIQLKISSCCTYHNQVIIN